jgi:peptidoglycan/xylan/chitin deacetylase (PgdA/CDA1 family)
MKRNLIEGFAAHLVSSLPARAIASRLQTSIATFTFDDFPRSAWEAGGPVLARYRAAATFFVSGSFCGKTLDGVQYYLADDLAEIAAAGHELGSHTFFHRRTPHLGLPALDSDLQTNANFIAHTAGVVPETFAYPFGHASIRTKMLLARRFVCCRGTEPGINRGLIDRGQLRALDLGRKSSDLDALAGWVAESALRPSWIIFFTHDIENRPTAYGSTPDTLEQALIMVQDAGLKILTMKDAWQACTTETIG